MLKNEVQLPVLIRLRGQVTGVSFFFNVLHRNFEIFLMVIENEFFCAIVF